MVPSRQYRGAVLPWEKQLMDALGMSPEEYAWYISEIANIRPERSAAYDHIPHVVCDPLTVSIVGTVVSTGLSFAAQALAPKPRLPKQSDPAQQASDVTGASVNAENRFTNVNGFTSVQPLARLGEIMPLVFANRQAVNGKAYGGVRVETKLLWSQLLSQGDGQELLALFLASAGTLATASIPDFDGFAIGDSLLRGYQSSKFAVYFQRGLPGEGRITPPDKIAGDLTARGLDVFQAELGNSGLKPIFSGVRVPNTMTTFGISEPLRNAQSWRLPFKRVRVVLNPFINPGSGGNLAGALQEYAKTIETFNRADQERFKTECNYSCRTGVVKVNGTTVGSGFQDVVARVGDIIEFHIYEGNTPNIFGTFGAQDIATKDDNYRQSCDDALIVGETYLIGGTEAVCTGSSPDSKLWDIATRKVYYFKATRDGTTRIVSDEIAVHGPDFRGAILGARINSWLGPTICKVAIGHITTTRKLDQVEIGIKSQVWKRFSGIANFSSVPDEGTLVALEGGGGTFNVGSYSDYGLRYSFFRIQVREKGTTEWITLDPQAGAPFCVKGRTPVDQFNFVRIRFPNTSIQYEIRFRPVSGGAYLAYNYTNNNPVCVLDARSGGSITHTISSPQLGEITVNYVGYREQITQASATNSVMFYGGKPLFGVVDGLQAVQYITNGSLNATTFGTTGGSGSGLTLSVYSGVNVTEDPVAAVITGFSTRWLHEDVMRFAPPSGLGQTVTGDVVFQHESSRDPWGNPYTVTVRMTLRSENLDDFGQGYTGLPYMWRNANLAGSIVTIVSTSAQMDLASGKYVVNKPSNSATPSNGTVQASINVTVTQQTIYTASVAISNGGSGYRVGDAIQITGAPISLPVMRVGSIYTANASTRIAEDYDAITDVYLYDQQEGSHQNGPEHQIAYVNEQRRNYKNGQYGPEEFAPQYDRMAMIGLQLRSGKEWNDFNNLTYYAKQGREVVRMVDPNTGDTSGYSPSTLVAGPSHLFPEILRSLLRSPLTGASKLVPEAMIDWPGFQEACKTCIANNWFWDGVIASPVNVREWAYETAPYFFLDFLILGGKVSLQPTFPVDPTQGLAGYSLAGAYDRLPRISALFTDGNIVEDSLQVSWYPSEQRTAPQVLVTVRDEVENGFAETRNILVRLDVPDSGSAPVEAVDFTGFCTSARHAVDFAKLLIQTRRYVTHTVTFKTFPEGLALAPGAYFKLASQARHVDRFQNGYVLDDGRVVTSTEITGSNSVYWWRSGMTEVSTDMLTVDGNGYAIDNKFAGSVFTVYSDARSARVYKAELISYDEEGMVEITGTHVPVTDQGRVVYLNLDESLFEIENEQ